MKIAKSNTQTMASFREKPVLPLKPGVKNRIARIVEINRRSGSSFEMVFLLIGIGLMMAAIPMSNRILTMLLPMTLPTSMSVLPDAMEEKAIASSGAPVPTVITVSPTSCLEILK